MDVRRKRRGQEERQSNNPLDDRIRCLEQSCVQTVHDVILTKNHLRIINMKTGEVMPLWKNRDMFILDMWMWIPASQSKIGECSDFVRQG